MLVLLECRYERITKGYIMESDAYTLVVASGCQCYKDLSLLDYGKAA